MIIAEKFLSGQKVYSFPQGGITFTDPSAPQRDSYVTAFLPPLSIIPLVQLSGERAYPVVSVGEQVKEGMLIGRSKGPGSANIHATVPGRVLRMVSWKNAAGQDIDGFVIRLEGCFEKLGKQEEVFSWSSMLPNDLQRLIADYGVVEMEGRGRPVSEMISSLRSASEPITLVVRCVFDDPWLAADYVLCRERTAEVVEGAAIIARTCRVDRILYTVSRAERELGESLITAGSKWEIPATTVLVGSRYPQQNRRELELVLMNYGKKEGVELGSLFILGPATLAAVFDAVKMRKPVLDRFISVGGSAVKRPQVMKVRIGKRIGEIFEECGGFTGTPKRVAAGSPLLGKPFTNFNEPLTKTMNSVFAIREEFRRNTMRNCISCGECRNVCPVGLDPEELYKKILINGRRNFPQSLPSGLAEECHGCGCCEVVCPSMLPLSTKISSYTSGGN